ncbi:MAG: hypothetical protein KDA61_12880, partial [Planctomycetales bacterium]|nr:hypothetical protein [Planctomycetales bacterium]
MYRSHRRQPTHLPSFSGGSKDAVTAILVLATASLLWESSVAEAAPRENSAPSDRVVELIEPNAPQGGWSFDNGREFPGAAGNLQLVTQEGAATLKLHGNFEKGGNYVQAARTALDLPIDALDFEVKLPAGVGKVTLRLIDGSGQCHQLNLRLENKGGWQKYSFPVAEYFASVAAGAPLDIVTGYQKWGGSDDGRWSQPLRDVVFLTGRDAMLDGSLLVRRITVTRQPPTTQVPTSLTLLDPDAFDSPWEYNNGDEFPGARGGIETSADTADVRSIALTADFSSGGRYVGMRRKTPTEHVTSLERLAFRAKTSDVESYSIRLVDETGQCHQRGGLSLEADGKWHEVVLDPQRIAGGEHWGGANDGTWHGALQLVELILNEKSADASPMRLELSEMRADTLVEAQESNDVWSATTDGTPGWEFAGDCRWSASDERRSTLSLNRSLNALREPAAAVGPKFPVRRGVWKANFTSRCELHSPDNSYHGSAALEVFDAAGSLLESLPIGSVVGKQDDVTSEATLALPTSAHSARFRLTLEKTYGSWEASNLALTRLAVQPPEPLVTDIRIASDARGNLFFPDESVAFQLTVNAARRLPRPAEVRYEVRNYLGDVVLRNEPATLDRQGRQYVASVQLDASNLQIGQFYELHVEASQGDASPATEFAGFAILPTAASKKFAADKIPFTIRNWDGRIGEYFHLADRLGLRTLGVWGGWDPKPPYAPHLPGVEICEKLGCKWITGTPAAEVERRGFEQITEESLRVGMTRFLEQYAARGLAMIALGNEPHGVGAKVRDNVRAYKIVYEAVKAFDPQIFVLGTSVEPNREYFENGYQNYLDAYDFHVYEHYTAVRQAMRDYRALMEEFHAVKPIHSTELGLNSQGQARLTVASELVKKCVAFFAEGGATVSWFTIMYPDDQGV